MDKNYFQILNDINVNDKTEKKSNLTYLSWAWAWAEVKKRYPLTFYTIYEDSDGMFYFNDGKTCWVKTGVTIDGLEHIEYLPVMDFKNKSIPFANVTSVDVNKTIQRSLTKALARHGLGLYIYAGEDLPENEPERVEREKEVEDIKSRKISKVELATLKAIIDKSALDEGMMLTYYEVADLKDLTFKQYDAMVKQYEKENK